jgi:murein L,D-transpeptidase YafK
MVRILCIFFIMSLHQSNSFKESQLTHNRVKNAYEGKEEVVKNLFVQKKIPYDGFHLFIRAFKKEKKLEVWVKKKGDQTYIRLNIYDICASSGEFGPKRQEGDRQVPEGVYHVNNFNPQSNFHLSLGVSYPNSSDNILSDPKHPGGAIYIHGNCVTIGCIPITDEMIEELYILAVEAKNNGQQKIPIHIFPARLDDAGLEFLKQEFNGTPDKINFWENLQLVYKDFEELKKLRNVKVDKSGKYYF